MSLRCLLLSLGLLLTTAHARCDLPDLKSVLAARFDQDRSGACLQAARIDGARVERTAFCAGRRDASAVPADDAAFEIGSVTKTMTAFLVADLITAGKWSLDDPIAAHLPEGTAMPRQGARQILVRDLLTHSSGLPPLPSRMGRADPRNPYAALSEADLLGSLADVQLTRPIGSAPAYSNFGMMVVSSAVSRAYGTHYEAALKARLLDPLDMKGTFVTTPSPGEPVALGHTARGTPASAWTITPNLAGVGMVKATLDDMVRYAAAAMADGPLAARMRMTHQPLTASSGMNWMRLPADGRHLLVHEGATGGFSSFLGLDPDKRLAVVILADTALVDFGGLGDVGRAMLGVESAVTAPRHTAPISKTLLEAMPGDFELGALKLHVRDDGARLFAQATGQAEFELLADDHGDLYPAGFDALLTPAVVHAQVDRFVWRQGGGTVAGVRASSTREAPAAGGELAPDCEGSYRLTPQFTLRVFRSDGRVMLQGTGQDALTAEVLGRDQVEVRAVGAVVSFNRDAKGAIVSLTLRQGGAVIEGAKQ